MESKYQEALDRLCENNYFDEKGNCNCDLIVMDRILLQELVDKAKELSNSNDELRRQLYFIEPYNFEDLKVGMWILNRKPQYEEYTFIKIKIRKYFLIIWNVEPENLKKTVSFQYRWLILRSEIKNDNKIRT